MMFDFTIKKCDISDIVLECIRFLSHIFIMGLLTYSLTDDGNMMFMDIFKSMLFAIIAIIIYQLIFKKVLFKTIKKMKKICNENNDAEINEQIIGINQ